MFELGMRLAFDKPTVIVKDDRTDYTFDTGVIEYLSYPRDLRFNRIVSFKGSLALKMMGTYKASIDDPNHSTFLKNFGKFQVANLEENIASSDAIILEKLSDMQSEISRLRRTSNTSSTNTSSARIRADAPTEEGYVNLTKLVLKYQQERAEQGESSLGDPEDYIMSKMNCAQYFPTYGEFKTALDRVLTSLRS
jgi:hypothetical protein